MGKGRPVLLTPELKRRIAAIIDRNKKKWTAAELRDEMRIFLHHKIEEKVKKAGINWSEKQINGEVARLLPGESAIQKFKQGVEATGKQPSPLDQPWHLGAMLDSRIDSRRYISPEAMEYIFRVKEWAIMHDREDVTIRQAYWIGQFYPSIPSIHKAKDEDLEVLWSRSWKYAWHERICKLSESDGFDTIETDLEYWIYDLARRANKIATMTPLGVGESLHWTTKTSKATTLVLDKVLQKYRGETLGNKTYIIVEYPTGR